MDRGAREPCLVGVFLFQIKLISCQFFTGCNTSSRCAECDKLPPWFYQARSLINSLRHRGLVHLGFFRYAAVVFTVSTLLSGCGGGADSGTTPALAAVKLRVVQMSYQTALPRYKALANDTPSDIVLGMNPGATYSAGPSFSGYAIAGVAMPTLSGWGLTPWIEVPAGQPLVPFLPDNTGNPQLTQFDFVACSEVSFVLRDCKLLPWKAVPLPAFRTDHVRGRYAVVRQPIPSRPR